MIAAVDGVAIRKSVCELGVLILGSDVEECTSVCGNPCMRLGVLGEAGVYDDDMFGRTLATASALARSPHISSTLLRGIDVTVVPLVCNREQQTLSHHSERKHCSSNCDNEVAGILP